MKLHFFMQPMQRPFFSPELRLASLKTSYVNSAALDIWSPPVSKLGPSPPIHTLFNSPAQTQHLPATPQFLMAACALSEIFLRCNPWDIQAVLYQKQLVPKEGWLRPLISSTPYLTVLLQEVAVLLRRHLLTLSPTLISPLLLYYFVPPFL